MANKDRDKKDIEIQSSLEDLIVDNRTTEILRNMLKQMIQEELNNARTSDHKRDEDGFLVAEEMDKHNLKNSNQTTVFDGLKAEYALNSEDCDFIVTDMHGYKHKVEIKKKPVYAIKDNPNPIKSVSIIRTEENYDFSSWALTCNVKQILEEKGLKQTWLQQKTQIPPSTLWSILNNEKAVTLENAMKISLVMNMPIDKLFFFFDVDKLTVDENSQKEK